MSTHPQMPVGPYVVDHAAIQAAMAKARIERAQAFRQLFRGLGRMIAKPVRSRPAAGNGRANVGGFATVR